MSDRIFSIPALLLLLAGAGALFALSVLLHAYDADPTSGQRAGPGSYSSSAIGSAGLYDFLRRMERPVLRSVSNTMAMVGARGTLVVAEPDLPSLSSSDGLKMLSAPRLLLVLPKWRGQPDPDKPAWISDAEPLHRYAPRDTLALITGRGDVLRQTWPEKWSVNAIGITPSGSGTVQLIVSPALRPLVGDAKGMLLGELRENGRTVWVLSDPDLMSNHGLFRGENALFMLTLLDRLRMRDNKDPGAPLVFDETVHGWQEAQGSPLKLMFRFPYVIVTLLLAGAAALLLLSGVGRFGPARKPAPAIAFGKEQLIENGARLLDFGGHHAIILKRYVRMCLRSAALSLHAPPGLDEPALAAWLDRIGKTRGLRRSCAEILRTATTINDGGKAGLERLFKCAGEIYRWKGELLNGPATSRRDNK